MNLQITQHQAGQTIQRQMKQVEQANSVKTTKILHEKQNPKDTQNLASPRVKPVPQKLRPNQRLKQTVKLKKHQENIPMKISSNL